MPPDISSSEWKIDRAKELLAALDAEVSAWIESVPYRLEPVINPEHNRASMVVRDYKAPPIVKWSLIVADILHNLRCAIDHAFWSVLVDRYPLGIPSWAEKLTFPIWDDPPTAQKMQRFSRLDADVIDAIKAVQPYNNPVTVFPIHELAIIRDIDNGNKHKLLFTLMSSVARLHVRALDLEKGYEDACTTELYRGEINEGVDVVVTVFDVGHPNMKYVCQSFVGIVAMKHPVANNLGQDRDDYASLIDALIVQTRQTINEFIVRV